MYGDRHSIPKSRQLNFEKMILNNKKQNVTIKKNCWLHLMKNKLKTTFPAAFEWFTVCGCFFVMKCSTHNYTLFNVNNHYLALDPLGLDLVNSKAANLQQTPTNNTKKN